MRFFFPIAMVPLSFFIEAILIVTVMVAILISFLGRKIRFDWHRLLNSCFLALILGPVAGATLAVVWNDLRASVSGWYRDNRSSADGNSRYDLRGGGARIPRNYKCKSSPHQSL